ncbi:MAG: cyclic nucleotide-binding domain-containing protein [Bacteriovoracaceae bacterium]|nr:cyclic nucleotide-binding domain-containing protein [Bacteriovoracaceae bacterium]
MSSFSSEAVEEKILKRGDILFKEGEKPKRIYLIAYGKIIGITKSTNRLLPLFVAEQNSIVGEEALTDKTWSYSAVAMSDCKLVPIETKDINDFLKSTPDWVQKIIFGLSERMTSIQQLISEQKISAHELSGGQELSAEDMSFLQATLK